MFPRYQHRQCSKRQSVLSAVVQLCPVGCPHFLWLHLWIQGWVSNHCPKIPGVRRSSGHSVRFHQHVVGSCQHLFCGLDFYQNMSLVSSVQCSLLAGQDLVVKCGLRKILCNNLNDFGTLACWNVAITLQLHHSFPNVITEAIFLSPQCLSPALELRQVLWSVPGYLLQVCLFLPCRL